MLYHEYIYIIFFIIYVFLYKLIKNQRSQDFLLIFLVKEKYSNFFCFPEKELTVRELMNYENV